MLQYSIIPFLFILYSWKSVPLGASTAETPIPALIFVFGIFSCAGGFFRSSSILLDAFRISSAWQIRLWCGFVIGNFSFVFFNSR